MANKTSRVTAVVIALVLFVTSVGTAVLVLLQIWHDNQQPTPASSQNQAADQPKANKGETKLEGTKLQNFTPVPSVADLQSTDLKVGNGEEVKPGATVTAHYTGALAKDGTIFQSSHDRGEPIEFSLSGVIPGWTEGVPGMKVGGVRRLVIPAAKAYGDKSPAANIPANSDLVFDIEITAVKNP